MSFVFKFTPEKTHVFIHIPKNGGTALWKTLGDYNPYIDTKKHRPDERFVGHLTYRETEVLFPPDEPLSFFCITRNPWARAVSYYHFIKQVSRKRHGAQTLYKLLKKGMSFDDFIIHITQSGQIRFKSQMDYMIDAKADLAIDDVLRLESIQSDLNNLLIKNDCPTLPAEKHNSSEHAHYTDYFTSDTSIQLVAEYEAGVIDLCNYQFGE
ncbi:sulfotransferase family protein [Opitutales bacterium]|nr:sulfotransferase family protein [Opitutales bacterium]